MSLDLPAELAQQLQARAEQSGESVSGMLAGWLATSPAPGAQARFFDLTGDLLCVLDADNRIQHANIGFANRVGAEREALHQQPFSLFVTADERATVREMLRAYSETRQTASFACALDNNDGTLRTYLWTLYPIMEGITHAVGRDITPYREMEAKEHERNIFAEALLDTIIAINSSLALEQVMERILSNVGKVVSYDHVNLMLIDGDKAEIVGCKSSERVTIQPRADNLIHSHFPIADDPHLQHMYSTQQSLILPKLETPTPWMVTVPTSEPAAFLGTPIIVEEAVIGFLGVFNFEQEFFTPLHAQHLLTFANQAGIAIKNAQLYEEAQSAAILKERQRMAQELHDSVNQNLFAASTYADLLPRAIEKKPERVERYAGDISRLVRGAVAQMRMILIELHPETLLATSLSTLLKQLCDAFGSHTGVQVEFAASGQARLEPGEKINIYRVAQEALHNIDKHAQATRVQVRLEVDAGQLRLSIEDDGVGFDPSHTKDLHFGIQGMQERAAEAGATLHIQSSPGGAGTYLQFTKPHNPGA